MLQGMEQSGADGSSTPHPQPNPPETDAASRNILVPIDDHEVSIGKDVKAVVWSSETLAQALAVRHQFHLSACCTRSRQRRIP